MTIGQRIKAAREAKGWSQKKLADKMLYTQGYISYIESGGRNPSSRSLMAFERALKVRIVK